MRELAGKILGAVAVIAAPFLLLWLAHGLAPEIWKEVNDA